MVGVYRTGLGVSCLALSLTLAPMLAGCGSHGDLEPGGELPVSCIAHTGWGSCAGAAGKFYYDYRDNRCKPATGYGCAGRTLFDSKERCSRYCGARP
jgi:hypothetical protein